MYELDGREIVINEARFIFSKLREVGEIVKKYVAELSAYCLKIYCKDTLKILVKMHL